MTPSMQPQLHTAMCWEGFLAGYLAFERLCDDL